MSLYKRGETWWIYITHDGRRIRRSTGTSDRREAKRIHDEIKAKAWSEKRGGHTLADALKLWLTAAPRSRNEKNAIRQFLQAYPSRPLAEVSGQDIAAALATKGPSHANRIINIVRAALNLAKDAGMISATPKIPRRKEPPRRLRWLTPEEWQRLDASLPEHLRQMARFALATGLRQANVFGLKWRDVDLVRRVAWVHAADAKSGKPIGVPLSEAAMAALRTVAGQHPEYVFTYRRNSERAPIRSPKTAWAKALEKAGITDFTWHDLRHTWASWHVMNGTPMAVLKELGGWSSMEMVMRYAHLAPDHVAQWADNSGAPQIAPQNASTYYNY